ncbi:MAG: phosphatase PAP2 family protein [Chloroflexi bacterium]|nr:phosphatase PAP2 family protein [Chloroflexota bacterium]
MFKSSITRQFIPSFSRRSFLLFAREILLVAMAYTAYMFIKRFVVLDVEPQALENASRVVSFETTLGIFRELEVQSWIDRNWHGLLIVLNWAYIFMFFPVLIIAAIHYYFYDRPRYLYYRDIVFFTFVFGLLVSALFPLAPPRFMPETGIIDTIRTYGPSWYGSREQAVYYNAFAAMPSLHFGWSVLFGVLFIRSKRQPWLKVAGVAYPSLMFISIVATGNHYFIDAVAGAIVVLVSYAVHEWEHIAVLKLAPNSSYRHL